MAKKHSETALQAVIDIVQNPEHPQRLKAAEIILDRAHGKARPYSDVQADEIIQRFMEEEISGIQACLLLEASGMQSKFLEQYANHEIKKADLENNRRPNKPLAPMPRA